MILTHRMVWHIFHDNLLSHLSPQQRVSRYIIRPHIIVNTNLFLQIIIIIPSSYMAFFQTQISECFTRNVSIIIHLLQMKKLRHREVNWFAQNHPMGQRPVVGIETKIPKFYSTLVNALSTFSCNSILLQNSLYFCCLLKIFNTLMQDLHYTELVIYKSENPNRVR